MRRPSLPRLLPIFLCILVALILFTRVQAATLDQPILDDLFTAQEWQARGNLEAARLSLEKALKDQPGNVFVSIRLAQVDALSGDLDRSLARLTSVLAQEPENLLALRWKGHVLLAQGQAAQAYAAYSQILKLDPGNGWAWLGVAASLLDQTAPNADRDAAAALEKAQAHAGEDADLRLALGDAFARLHLLVNARFELERALDLNPRDTHALVLAGEVYLRLGLRDLALESWRQALVLDPAMGRAKANLLLIERQGALPPGPPPKG